MDARPALIEFPADDPERARRFWAGLLGVSLSERTAEQGEGWQTAAPAPAGEAGTAAPAPAGETGETPAPGDPAPAPTAVGVHERGRGPGDRVSLPYFDVDDLPAALERVTHLGGTIVHSGARTAVCRDSEGSPFGLTLAPVAG